MASEKLTQLTTVATLGSSDLLYSAAFIGTSTTAESVGITFQDFTTSLGVPTFKVNGVNLLSQSTVNFVQSSNMTITNSSGGTITFQSAGGGGGGGNEAYYTYLASQLEPLAIEVLQLGTFTYAINSSTTKMILNAWNTNLGSGRWEQREPRFPMPLRDVTLTGLSSTSMGVIIDPSAGIYSNAHDTYFDRLNTLATSATKYLSVSTGNTSVLFLPGPYGNIITSVNVFDATWLIMSPSGVSGGWNLTNENGDAAAQAIRYAMPLLIPVSKNVGNQLQLGTERSGGDAEGSITYVICQSTWGAVPDPNTYIFSDDFTGATLDTATVWTRAQSTAGNVEINTNFAWCKAVGNSNWGTNGAYSQTTTVRANGKVFLCDAVVTNSSGGYIVGWSDAGGQSYTNFSHGVHFSSGAAIHVYENGNDRGAVGSGWSVNTIYRIRITLGNSNNAAYAIQGGSQYQKIGSNSWTDITPGTTSSSTTPLAAGFSAFANTNYVGYPRLYT